jgi:DNA gyrase inhibitor GyrI
MAARDSRSEYEVRMHRVVEPTTLPGGRCAVHAFRGSVTEIVEAWTALTKWVGQDALRELTAAKVGKRTGNRRG